MKRIPLRLALLAIGLWLGWTVQASAQAIDMAKFLPDNTEMAFAFNVKSVLNSALYQKHFKEEIDKRIKENSQLQKVMESLGFDPLKDITDFTMTFNKFNVKGPGQPPDVDAFVVVKGAFNVEKMTGALGALIAAANQGDRVSTSAYGNYTVYEVKDSNSGRSFFATIFDKETVLGSTVKEQVTEAIERGLGKKTGTMNAKFSELMGKIRSTDTMWGAFLMPASVKDMAKMSPNPEAGEVLSKFESQTMTLNVKDNVTFNVNMNLADEGAANQLKTLMEQAKELAGAAALSNEQLGSDLADLVSSLQLASNGKKVTLAGKVSAELVDKIVKMVKDRGR